jgi:hypothetical protein
MPWIACEWDAETDKVTTVGKISHVKRRHAVYDCISAAEAASPDTPEDLLWMEPMLPDDSERKRNYAVEINGVVDLFKIHGTFIEGGWVTSELRDYTQTKVSQFFPLMIPKKLLMTELPPIPEEFPPLTTRAPTVTPASNESAWHAVVNELKSELKQRKRKVCRHTPQ